MASTKTEKPDNKTQRETVEHPLRDLGAGKKSSAGRKPLPSVFESALPNSKEAEMAVLGAILYRPDDAIPLVVDQLSPEHFYYSPNVAIYREMLSLIETLRAVDQVTLTQRLRDKDLFDEVGGAAYLAELIMGVPHVANLEHYIEVVCEKYQLRQLIGACSEIVDKCFQEQADVKGWLDEVEQQVFKITYERTRTGARPIKDLIKDAMGVIEQLYDKQGAITGIPTGFRDLDKLTSGLQESTVFVVAARPSVGKTALAMNIAEHVAVDLNIPVGVFSLEMSSEELVKRLLCSRARVNLRSVHDGFLAERDFHPLTTAASQLMKSPLYIDDTAGLTINQVRARARRMQSQYGIRLIVIDYLQLMRAPSRRAEASRQMEITDISAGVKALAKELSLPIIVLSQLNRQPEAREGGTPRLADLRESGSIEQDADVVGLLVRPELYEDDKDAKQAREGEATLIIAKQRNGPTGDVDLTFLKEHTRFVDRARVDEEDIPQFERSGE